MKKKGKILVVDDNAGIRSALKILLPMHFEAVELIPSPVSLISTVESFRPDVILLDMNFMPRQGNQCEANFSTEINTGSEGLFWLSELKERFPELKVVLFTAYADIQLAVEGMKRGAFDFITKPWDNEQLISILSSACKSDKKEQKTATAKGGVEMFWGSSDAMEQIRRTVQKIAPTDATILITGENGTGKDVMAREVHRQSLRSGKPMVSVDAGAIPDTLFESELFGHVKGAFTDAHADRKGLFEQADGGTIFLDEIGNISMANQAKLLRVLQNRTITRVGSSVATPVDIRLICATNVNLDKLVTEGRFREDLYYRINTMHLQLPPLRERLQDILPLAQRFIASFSDKYHRTVRDVDKTAAEAMLSYPWNGNIRELQNCIEKAVILCEENVLTAKDLGLPQRDCHSLSGLAMTGSNHSDDRSAAGISSSPEEIETFEEAEERTIRTAMAKYDGNLSLVAKALNVSRPTLYNKLKKYGI